MKYYFCIESMIGPLTIVEDGEYIAGLYFGEEVLPPDLVYKETNLIKKAKQQLNEYFSGQRKVFDLPLKAQGTSFQQKVWKALQEIPYGETRSYGQIAARIDQPKASRAVGGANNKNPIAIFVPCHRVIGANGSLVGFGGGLDIKQQLLTLEREHA